jgi:hypothetical protein
MSADGFCVCDHEWAVHDAYGCCAFLGAYPETKEQRHYCPCKVPVACRGSAAGHRDAPQAEAGGAVEDAS